MVERTDALAERDSKLVALQAAHERLWKSYALLKEELALVKRRMFVATAERVDTSALQLEFTELVAKMDKLAGVLPAELTGGGDGEATANSEGDGPPKKKRKKKGAKPNGRRDLADADLPETRIEIPDELFEQLVAEGKAERIGFERSYKLGYQRGGETKLIIDRVKYRAANANGEVELETAAVPKEVVKRCLAAPSTLAHIATSKFCDGLPLYRQQDILARAGASIDRGTMSRWLEELGGAFGATVIEAANKDSIDNAFCMLTDATGFSVQPGRFENTENNKRRPCSKGHYFVRIADQDHVLFDFVKRHNTNSVRAMFKGYAGYIQADASSVYNALFRPAEPDDPEDDGCVRLEVACWSHARRKYWEAALAKQKVAREALLRIAKLFELDARLRKGNPPSKIKKLRNQHLRPLVDELLEFASVEYERVKNERGSLRSALGYSVRQADALRAFLDDGRLRLDNNPSESELRKVVRIRDASLFAGSDGHAKSAGHILSMIASARLHHLDPERYLRDIIRVLPYWPRERYLELTAKHWTATRAKLNHAQLAAELGRIDVPAA
ncbi:MAG: IS66 family transposase [bacterium]|nr:IS66 family transposase [bacterium]